MHELSPSLTAGVMLAALPWLKRHKLPAPTASAVLAATGASRTTSYKVKALVDEALPALLRPPGRPPAEPPQVDVEGRLTLARACRDFLIAHPGAVTGSERQRYSDRFRLFVLDLAEARRDIPIEAFAIEMAVPLGTLKDWLRGERPQVDAPANLAQLSTAATRRRIESVLAAWSSWDGGFRPFCVHVQFHLRIPLSRQHIRDLLHAHGVRIQRTRGRPADASARRDGFETFFPNAQWVGDGTELVVTLCGVQHKVNLELLVDAHTGAFTGASIRPTEDAAAVIEAFTDGVATTEDPPLAVLLDNKPSNHADEVVLALGDTLKLRSRPYTPTDKPHAEGAFGLFKREAPPLVIDAATPEQLAAEIARLVATTWARAANHRPRLDRNGDSRAKLFGDAEPSESQIEAALAALRERQAKAEKARETRARRQDPVVRSRLDQAFDRLGLEDPDEHLRTAIASWPLDAVVEGIAIFEGKKRAGTLPEGVDGRYLRGIVKNIVEEREGFAIALALIEERLATRDELLAHLDRQRDALEDTEQEPEQLVKRFVDHAMVAQRGIDRTFWLLATADVIQDQGADVRMLLRLAARRIHATFAVPHRERLAATRLLFAKVIPTT